MAESPGKVREVIERRLYTVTSEDYSEKDLEGVTVLVNLGESPYLTRNVGRYLCIFWATEENVDQAAFEGLIRLCGSSMKGKKQRVLIVGHQDVVDVVAACVLREYLGASARAAVGIIRRGRKKCMLQSGLVETVRSYRPS